ncbi:shavenoid isoform 1-T7 [Glossina fuscipes fuscipes]
MPFWIRNVAGNMFYACILSMLVVHQINASLVPVPGPTEDNVSTQLPDDVVANEARGVNQAEVSLTNLLGHTALLTTATTGPLVNLTRQHDGDIFWANGLTTCNMDTCVGLSSGTASWLSLGVDKNDPLLRSMFLGSLTSDVLLTPRRQPVIVKTSLLAPTTSASSSLLSSSSSSTSSLSSASVQTSLINGESCQCRCLPYLNTYREDLGICVDDIHECTLSPFVSGSSKEKIPFVFLPLRGQIIYPSREINFPDIRTPVCAVTGAQYLTTNGWSDLRNPIDNDYPFRMFRDEGRTFLQWLGEPDLRHKMQGRLIVVHLVCRDMSLALNATNIGLSSSDHIMPPKNVFSPCVAFRVNGSPVKYANNVSEVLFQSEATTTLASTSDGMSTKEYIVIGICSLLLGLIYVSSVFLYLHMKKRKSRDQHHMRNSLDDLTNEINYPKNDQVTFGAPFARSGSLYSGGSLTTSNEPRSRASLSSLKEEMGIVKNNPLLQHFPQLSDHHSGFASDISNSASECEMDGGYHDKFKQMQTNVIVHPQMVCSKVDCPPKVSGYVNTASQHQIMKEEDCPEITNSSTQENECLPIENVAIIEDMMTEEKLENLRAMVNGNVRKKLYFNPAYFEPHLLAQPPPAALEFLSKIREVISIAKYKMASKRYQPSLTLIPEEGTVRSGTPSLYGSQMQTTSECQGCVNNRCSGHVKNCGEKRNSIEKWLQTVSSSENSQSHEHITNSSRENTPPNRAESEIEKEKSTSSSSSDKVANSVNSNVISRQPLTCQGSLGRRGPQRKDITPPKQKPPPPPINKSNAALSSRSSSAWEHGKSNYPIESKNCPKDNDLIIYQHYHTPQLMKNSITIPISPTKYDTFSALSAAANIYGYAETGSEIYNNPKFSLHDSPAASQRSHGSSHRSKNSRKRLDALDQYAVASTPSSLASGERQHYDMLRSMEQMPDHIDQNPPVRDFTATIGSNGSFHLDIPTPDYDSTMEKKIKDIYNNTQSSGPSVPTPDYSSLSRKSLKQYQPDSPIYRRKSPQYLIVDYETDSLERLENTKHKTTSQSSSSPSSDVSSQLSPSLSTALPLEEELEITHTMFGDRLLVSKPLTGIGKKLTTTNTNPSVSKKNVASRIKYDTPFRGSMTIEVEHEPPSDLERSTDSDQYEPDTLDRKPKKQSFCDVSAWSAGDLARSQLQQQQTMQNEPMLTESISLPNILAPPATGEEPQICKIQCHVVTERHNSQDSAYESQMELRRQFSAQMMRQTKVSANQSLLTRQSSDRSCRCGKLTNLPSTTPSVGSVNAEGRILTLEAKHSRRQRPSESGSTSPLIEISNETPNKTTIKISTPKANRILTRTNELESTAALIKPRLQDPIPHELDMQADRKVREPPNYERSASTTPTPSTKRKSSLSPLLPPPPPPTSATTTLNSKASRSSPQRNYMAYSATEDETLSNHSESTEITGISETMPNSEFSGTIGKFPKLVESENTIILDKCAVELEKVQLANKLKDEDYGAIFNTHINGLRTDYSLNKYKMNKRKLQDKEDDNDDDGSNNTTITDSQLEANNNLKNSLDTEVNKLDTVSLSSRSNRSSSRLSQRTKEMYRNAGVPVGIAYPQRSTANSSGNNSTTNNSNVNSNNAIASSTTSTTSIANVQSVYRCEIEPVQLTHGMQIAMGLKDRPKKAKDIKNAWRKFVSMAASKFSPTQSPAPPYEKKNSSSLIDVMERDEGISSTIDDHARMGTPKSSYSAPASQNYYEQRFGSRIQEMDSGYMSADSAEAHKRGYYDRYNFKMLSGRERIIRVETIEDQSDGENSLKESENNANITEISKVRNNLLDSNRYEDMEQSKRLEKEDGGEVEHKQIDSASDSDSDKTLIHSNGQRSAKQSSALYTSDEDEQPTTTSYGSSETDGEINPEDMWESGAESIETHSVLYKNIRKSVER